MIVAVLQPYFFPYIGYFQLMNAVDTFVYLDDVQYIERGWVNRNRIRNGNRSMWLTMPVVNASRSLSIRERNYVLDGPAVSRLTRTLTTSYRRGSGFAENWSMINALLANPEPNVASYNCHLLSTVARALGFRTTFLRSSEMKCTPNLKGEQRIIELCRRLGARHYVNPIGGLPLYGEDRFEASGISLSFLRTRVPPATLDGSIEHLSILDHLLWHGAIHTRAQLPDYDLLTPEKARAQAAQARATDVPTLGEKTLK